MKKMSENVGSWLRGLVWTAMIFGCAWASAQSYTITSPEGAYQLEAANVTEGVGSGHSYTLLAPAGTLTAPAGRYHVVAMGAGEGVGLGAGVGAGGGAQNAEALPKDDLFAGTEVFAKGASDITEITMDPDTLNLVGGKDRGRAHNMVLNVVRTYTYDKPGMYNMADVDAIRNKLNTGDWHCSVHVRDLKNGSGSDVCNKRRTDGMRETAIIEVSAKSLTFIHTIRRENGEGGPGESELGYFPMLPGMNGLTSLAMIDPDAFADMQLGLRGMPYVFAPGLGTTMMMTAPLARLYTMTPGMKLKMDDMQKQLKDLKVKPFSQEQMKELQEKMKGLQDDLNKDRTAPAAPTEPGPATPKAAPATPQAPQ